MFDYNCSGAKVFTMDMISVRDGFYERDGFSLGMDFSVPPSSITAVIGPSGAGKSTLLNIIAGFDHLQRGTLVLNGEEHGATPPADRPVNFVFQDNNSFAHLSARNNVALGIVPHLKLLPEQWLSVDHALEQVGIAHLAARRPGDMSGGERQRIALARVLVRPKPILLLDEAFAALGPALRREMLDLVKKLQMDVGLTVLMVTHQPDDARLIADHVMFVASGKVRAPQSVGAFFASGDKGVQQHLGEQR
jgi:thiamine transport system ATP-binding protein